MLPKGLNLDQELDPFGFSIFTTKGQSQLSLSVLILLLKTIILRAIPMTRMLGQSAQVRALWHIKEFNMGLMGFPNRRNLSLIPRIIMRIWITAFRTLLGENSSEPVTP